MVTRLALTWLVVAATLTAAGCPCDSGLPDLFYDGLQARCGGLPCGWTATAGDVAQVETFHSGERGLRLAVGGAAERDLPEVSLPGAFEQGAVVSLLVACDAQTALVFEVDVTRDVPDQTSGERTPLTLVARREPTPGDSAGGPLLRSVLVLELSSGEDVPPSTATALRVFIDGPGVCTFDELHLAGARSFTCQG
ncbi:MAG: hypothetical protein CVU56_13175 [Deltaproteobacteria bacterium HGW-Deltaproteobacteria-14]|jgi:hypothetical protein|nr:MAG: hypothetical protein CVU56_13175 [Deltaproteobacteria bacterium HGW-Deltaproteobacteria-14]